MRDITFARYRLIGIARLPIVSEKADFTGLPSPLSLFVRGLSPRFTFGAERLKRGRCNYRAGNKLVCHGGATSLNRDHRVSPRDKDNFFRLFRTRSFPSIFETELHLIGTHRESRGETIMHEKQKPFDNEAFEPNYPRFFAPLPSSSCPPPLTLLSSASSLAPSPPREIRKDNGISGPHKNRYFRRRNDCTRLNDRPGKGNFIFSRSAAAPFYSSSPSRFSLPAHSFPSLQLPAFLFTAANNSFCDGNIVTVM